MLKTKLDKHNVLASQSAGFSDPINGMLLDCIYDIYQGKMPYINMNIYIIDHEVYFCGLLKSSLSDFTCNWHHRIAFTCNSHSDVTIAHEDDLFFFLITAFIR